MGPNGQEIGSANWTINGRLEITAEASKINYLEGLKDHSIIPKASIDKQRRRDKKKDTERFLAPQSMKAEKGVELEINTSIKVNVD